MKRRHLSPTCGKMRNNEEKTPQSGMRKEGAEQEKTPQSGMRKNKSRTGKDTSVRHAEKRSAEQEQTSLLLLGK